MSGTKKVRTGRVQHRVYKPLFGKPKLVLQYEWRCSGTEYDMHHRCDRDYDYTMWEDATVIGGR